MEANARPPADAPEGGGADRVPAPRAEALREPAGDTLLERLHRALGPLAGGMILDFADLATFGPLGLVLGPFVGAAVGWWVSALHDFSWRGRTAFALLAAAYLTLPATGLLPLATLIAAVARFRAREDSPTS